MRYRMTCDEAIEQVLAELSDPIAEAEFVERVLQLWPSQAKNPQQSVKSKLNYRPDVIHLGDNRIASAAFIFTGTQFRLQLNAEEREWGGPLAQRFTGFTSFSFLYGRPQFIDASTGHPIPFEWVDVGNLPSRGLLGHPEILVPFAPWLEQVGYQPEDSLILEILDYPRGHFRIRHEPAADRQEERIARQNERLTAALEQVLPRGALSLSQLVPRLYAALPTRREYPGDPWSVVVRRDGRFSWTDYGYVMRGPAPPSPFGYGPRRPFFPEDEALVRLQREAEEKRRAELEERYQEFQRDYAAARQKLLRPGLAEGPPAQRTPTRRMARRRSEELLQSFDEYLRRQGQSVASRQQKKKDLEHFSDFLAQRHHLPIGAANFNLLEEFFFQGYLRTAGPPSQSGLRRLFASLRQFYEYWEAQGHPEGKQGMEVLFSLKEWAERKLELVQQIPEGEEFEDLREAWLGKPARQPSNHLLQLSRLFRERPRGRAF